MSKAFTGLPIEPRWPVALAIIAVLILLRVLPDRVRFGPVWLPLIPGLVMLAALVAVPLSGAAVRWLRIERLILLLFCLIVGTGTVVSLAYLIGEMINRSTALDGLKLLTSSIAVWITNVLVFSLLYWQIDLGGPEARLKTQTQPPDWLFPQADLDNLMPHWRPTFVDYFFLAYTTATAFSPTDALPLTARAKLWMMLESGISLATILVVVSRAINILGS
jgi:hypothetical protein